MVTIRQVAKKAGVSIGTVSRVLNNKPGVSRKTRQRVSAIAYELGYTIPKRIHVSASKVTHLGLLSPPMTGGVKTNPFYHNVFLGVEQVCQAHHINLSFNTLDIHNGSLRSFPPLSGDENVSGLVMVGAIPYEALCALSQASGLPVVLVDNCFPDSSWDSVMIDNVQGTRLATEYLIARDHHHITFINGPHHPSIVERCLGYEQVLRQHNLIPTIFASAGLEPTDGAWGVTQTLRHALETTAFVCANDSQAIGAIKRLQELGYKVPEDFSVIGFDDIDLTQFISPPITTIHVDRVALGQIATEMLLARITHPDRPIFKTVVAVALVERASVSVPRAAQPAFAALECR